MSIDRFVYITDTHFRRKAPISRKDDFFQSLLDKLDYVIGFCKKKKVKNLLHGGDLFHSPYVSDYVAGTIAKKLRESGLNVYMILGNHDITGKNAKSYLNGKLHLFENYPWFELIGDKYIEFSNCYVTGFHYDIDLETPKSLMVDDKDKLVICMTHSMIAEKGGVLINNKFNIVGTDSIMTNARVVLTGHYHIGFKVLKPENPMMPYWCNPGSFARLSTLENREGVGPGFLYIKIKSEEEPYLKWYPIPCDKAAFKENVSLLGTEREEDLKIFERAVKELENGNIVQGDIFLTLNSLIENKPKKLKKLLNKRIINICRVKVQEAVDEKA